MLKFKNSKRGQAITEFIPSMIIFFMVITGALAFYRVIRSATIKQEVVRNLTFAKIRNSGTLTTTPEQVRGGGSAGDLPELIIEGGPVAGVTGFSYGIARGQHDFVTHRSNCFTVYPSSPNETQNLGPLYLGGNDLGDLSFSTYAVMYRDLGASCP